MHTLLKAPRFLTKPLLITTAMLATGVVSANTLSGTNSSITSLYGENSISDGYTYINQSQGGTLNNNGWLDNNNGATLKNNGMLKNNNWLNNSGWLDNSSGATLNNREWLDNNSGATLNNSGTLNNYHAFINNEGSTIEGSGSYTQTAGQTTLGRTSIMTQANVNINSGVLGGSGVINSNVTANGSSAVDFASLTPGNSIGTLRINGDFTQGQFGALAIEFDETSTDLLDISGLATLGGTLEFIFTGTDMMTGSFNFLNFGSIAGTFDSILLPVDTRYNFDVAFGNTSANLMISAVPEPSTYALMLAGLGLVGFMARRRKQA